MRIYIFILLLINSCIVFAGKVPGYQGLRFSIKYDAGIMQPVLVGRNGNLPMLYHNASIDYVITRDLSIGLKYDFMFYQAAPEKNIFPNFDVQQYGDPNDYKGKYVQHNVAFILKKFFRRSGYIAPVGRYVSFGLYYQHVSDHMYGYPTSDPSNYGLGTQLVGFKGVANYGGFIIGLGRNFVVANRLLIDLGANINVAPVIKVNAPQEIMAVYRDVMLRNLLQIYLGFGVLAF